MIKKALIYLVVLFVFMGLVFVVFSRFQKNTVTGKDCCDIELRSLDGRMYKFSKFRGRPTLVVFWASWCPHCRKEMPLLRKLYKDESSRVNMVLVSMDRNINELKSYLEASKFNLMVFMRNGELADCLGGIRGVPTIFLLDETLVPVKKFEGVTPNKDIKSAIEKMQKDKR